MYSKDKTSFFYTVQWRVQTITRVCVCVRIGHPSMICLIWIRSWLHYKVEKRMIRPEESLWLFRPGRERWYHLVELIWRRLFHSISIVVLCPRDPPKVSLLGLITATIILLSPRFSRLFILDHLFMFPFLLLKYEGPIFVERQLGTSKMYTQNIMQGSLGHWTWFIYEKLIHVRLAWLSWFGKWSYHRKHTHFKVRFSDHVNPICHF